MDPFSLTVGIVGLVGLAAQTLKVTTIYIHEAKHGKEAAAEFLKELEVLHYNLSQLDTFLKSRNAEENFDNTSVLVTSTSACRTKLTLLHEKLTGAGESLFSRMKWPLSSKEHREAVQELRAFAQWIQFALTVDGCALLSKTSAEVLETLQHQLETFQLVKNVDHRTQMLERSLEHQAQIAEENDAAKERKQILGWLSILKYEEKHHDVRVRRMNGTGEWLLHDKAFRRWRDEPAIRDNVLWCHGIQGSGKSVLASLVIDQLRDIIEEHNVAVAHLYFDYEHQEHQSIEAVIASLLKQLAMAETPLPRAVLELYQKLNHQQRSPQQQDLEQAMLLTCRDFDRVYIVIDALDECETNRRKMFLDFLDTLRQKSSSSIFVTSRPYLDDVTKAFKDSSQITIKAEDSDLRKYISREIQRSDAVEDISDNLKKEIVEKVVRSADQMFLLAALQVRAILEESTPGEMKDALDVMPQGLNNAFEETLKRIQKQPNSRKRLAMNTLMWISHARRPLKVKELSEALAINLKPGETFSNSEYWQPQKRMVASCLGLVHVDEESSIIRLVHYSVQEYFREHQNQIFPQGECNIAKNSITYLLYDSFAEGPRRTEAEIRDLCHSQPFAIYAARYWGDHLRNVTDPIVDALAMRLLRANDPLACSIQISQYVRGRRGEYWNFQEVESRNGLQVAAGFGLEKLVEMLLDSGECDVNSISKMGTTPLIEAAAKGHRALIRTLVVRGADLTKENWYGTALHCAAEAGSLASISELLSTSKMNVDIRDQDGRTPLHCATISDHLRAMQLLLEKGAQVDALSNQGYTSLRYAVVWEQPLRLIRLLLANKADTEIPSRSGFTVLHHAVEMNLEDSVVLLLSFGANVNARRHGCGVTPLHLAAEKNNSAVVNLLLNHGADVNAPTEDHVTPLYSASEHGSAETVRLMLDKAPDIIVDAADEEGLTPLHVAIKEDHEDVVRILLVGGANVNARSHDDGSALDFASERGCERIASLLLANGAVR